MADTGAPWNLPYPLPTDLVRDGADAIKDLAEATADSLGLVAVKHVLKTNTFSASVAAAAHVAVTGLEISHAVADAANKVVLFAQISTARTTAGGAAFAAGGTLLNIGDADGSRRRTSAAGAVAQVDHEVPTLPVVLVYEPMTTDTVVYDVRVVNISTGTANVFVNRSGNDTNSGFTVRPASSFVLMEVKV